MLNVSWFMDIISYDILLNMKTIGHKCISMKISYHAQQFITHFPFRKNDLLSTSAIIPHFSFFSVPINAVLPT